ncbi:MAG: hypothetical protein AAFV53_34200 [Myxococcota bacterium]
MFSHLSILPDPRPSSARLLRPVNDGIEVYMKLKKSFIKQAERDSMRWMSR